MEKSSLRLFHWNSYVLVWKKAFCWLIATNLFKYGDIMSFADILKLISHILKYENEIKYNSMTSSVTSHWLLGRLCNFLPIGHLGFLGWQLKRVSVYVIRAAFYDLVMFFSPPAHFLLNILTFTNFPINSFSLPWHTSFAEDFPGWVNAGQSRIRGTWNPIK